MKIFSKMWFLDFPSDVGNGGGEEIIEKDLERNQKSDESEEEILLKSGGKKRSREG